MTSGCLLQQHFVHSKLNNSANQIKLAGKPCGVGCRKQKKDYKKVWVDLCRDNVKAIQIKNLQIQAYEYMSIITCIFYIVIITKKY